MAVLVEGVVVGNGINEVLLKLHLLGDIVQIHLLHQLVLLALHLKAMEGIVAVLVEGVVVGNGINHFIEILPQLHLLGDTVQIVLHQLPYIGLRIHPKVVEGIMPRFVVGDRYYPI